jgi:hypothetical protein
MQFIITVSWWQSLSFILIILIIDILMILYVKVFIKLGNTPFEHFSRHCYIISKSSNLTILYVHGKRFEIEVWLHILWHEFWDIEKYGFGIYVLRTFDINIYSLWRYLWFTKFWIWNGDLIAYILCTSFDMFLKASFD